MPRSTFDKTVTVVSLIMNGIVVAPIALTLWQRYQEAHPKRPKGAGDHPLFRKYWREVSDDLRSFGGRA